MVWEEQTVAPRMNDKGGDKDQRKRCCRGRQGKSKGAEAGVAEGREGEDWNQIKVNVDGSQGTQGFEGMANSLNFTLNLDSY